jgi:hypothetical protein
VSEKTGLLSRFLARIAITSAGAGKFDEALSGGFIRLASAEPRKRERRAPAHGELFQICSIVQIFGFIRLRDVNIGIEL